MFREAVDGFEEEKLSLDTKLAETSKLLQHAVQDIMYLTNRNSQLEKELRVAAAWEPAPV